MDKITVNGEKYEIIKLLGKGKGGYSYLAEKDGNCFVLKQIHHEPCDYYKFGNKLDAETCAYTRLKALGILMPRLYEIDEKNERILKEYIEGKTVFELVLENKLPDMCFEKIKEMCGVLYPAGLNIDYFPTNFVLGGNCLYYIDYECNTYSDQWNFENWGIRYWTKTEEFDKYVKENSAQA